MIDSTKCRIALIGYQSAIQTKMPGGEFLIVRINKNVHGEYGLYDPRHKPGMVPYEWDLTSPDQKVCAIVGMATRHKNLVFEVNNVIYVRVYKHIVENKSIKACPKVYQKHPNVWRSGTGQLALTPYTGEYIPFNPPT